MLRRSFREGSAGRPRPSVADDLMQMIDEHLAWQTEQAALHRSASRETLLVDWDGNGVPQVSYRNHQQEAPIAPLPGLSQTAPYQPPPRQIPLANAPRQTQRSLQRSSVSYPHSPRPPPINVPKSRSTATTSQTSPSYRKDSVLSSQSTKPPPPAPNDPLKAFPHEIHRKPVPSKTTITAPDGLIVTYHRPRPSSPAQTRVSGYDPSTTFSYNYNGHTMHMHRGSTSRSSQCSEYYAVDAAEYSPSHPVRIADTEPATFRVHKKREVVGAFVKRVLGRLEGLGVMRLFREGRRGI